MSESKRFEKTDGRGLDVLQTVRLGDYRESTQNPAERGMEAEDPPGKA